MKIETEAKIKVDDLGDYRQRLDKLGAAWQSKRIERDCFFDEADKSLHHNGCGLRLRQESDDQNNVKIILCFKGPVDNNGAFKQRQEIEVGVEDLARTQMLLESLGFELILTFEKVRTVWLFNDCEVCLDHIVELGDYIEIEGPGEEPIEQVIKQLGLNGSEHIHTGYARLLTEHLLAHEGKNHRREILLEHSGFDFERWME